eukprot:Lithocolla_globosa_v1_NODE_1384_length_2617_cov_4.443794.p3 type:complete len:149 gc:universal NODE_1384_length_2617_cov_4.443794:729-1175(+)
MNSVQLSVGDRQVAWPSCTCRQQHGVVVVSQPRGRDGLAHVAAGDKPHALGLEQIHPSLHHLLVQLHVGDAVHQQPADPVGSLMHGHIVPSFVELVGRRQACGTGAHHHHALACPALRGLRPHPPLGERTIDDGTLDALNGDRKLVDS